MDNSGLVVLLEQDQYEDLARMYSLFKRLDEGLNMIRKIMGEHLKTAGSALVQDPESTKDPVDFVHRLLAMKDKYDRCVCHLLRAGMHWLHTALSLIHELCSVSGHTQHTCLQASHIMTNLSWV